MLASVFPARSPSRAGVGTHSQGPGRLPDPGGKGPHEAGKQRREAWGGRAQALWCPGCALQGHIRVACLSGPFVAFRERVKAVSMDWTACLLRVVQPAGTQREEVCVSVCVHV